MLAALFLTSRINGRRARVEMASGRRNPGPRYGSGGGGGGRGRGPPPRGRPSYDDYRPPRRFRWASLLETSAKSKLLCAIVTYGDFFEESKTKCVTLCYKCQVILSCFVDGEERASFNSVSQLCCSLASRRVRLWRSIQSIKAKVVRAVWVYVHKCVNGFCICMLNGFKVDIVGMCCVYCWQSICIFNHTHIHTHTHTHTRTHAHIYTKCIQP